MASKHEELMRQCIELGREAAREGEVPVGAIVLFGERVLARGCEETRSSLER